MAYSVKENVRKLKAYSVESKRLEIKLDANENPYSIPDKIENILKSKVSYENLNRYPDARAVKLCSKLAEYVGNGINGEMVMVGDGSDELINIIISAYLSKGSAILLPTPGFAMYNVFSSINEGRIIQFERDEDFNIDMDRMIEVIKEEKPTLVFLCNPNNPTGTLTDRESIIKLIESSECMVVIDEAYYEFSGLSVADLINKYDNLIIMRTLSKAWGLAGLRLGYLVSNKNIINDLLKVKSPFNVNSITQDIGCLFLDYKDYMVERTEMILKEREWLIQSLKSINDIKIFDTSANFIMIKVKDAQNISDKLREAGIAIRNFNNYQGIKDCIRITVGTREENNRLIEILKVHAGE